MVLVSTFQCRRQPPSQVSVTAPPPGFQFQHYKFSMSVPSPLFLMPAPPQFSVSAPPHFSVSVSAPPSVSVCQHHPPAFRCQSPATRIFILSAPPPPLLKLQLPPGLTISSIPVFNVSTTALSPLPFFFISVSDHLPFSVTGYAPQFSAQKQLFGISRIPQIFSGSATLPTFHDRPAPPPQFSVAAPAPQFSVPTRVPPPTPPPQF